MDNSGEGGGSLGYYKALGGSGKSGGHIFHNPQPTRPFRNAFIFSQIEDYC